MALFKKNIEEVFNNNEGRRYNLKSNGKYEIIIKDNFISITQSGFKNMLNKGIVGTKNIDMNNITAVQYKAPGMTTGYMQLALLGSQEVKGGVMGAVKDENTILFTKKEEKMVLEIKEYIENFISNKNKHNEKNDNNSGISIADEILKFKQLLDAGAITQEEFEKQKNILLTK